ncbi:hypothetical protein AB837_00607 [bacterium AB1]|nr:hypothetical protein AB837_00607 [bacterium AB1]
MKYELKQQLKECIKKLTKFNEELKVKLYSMQQDVSDDDEVREYTDKDADENHIIQTRRLLYESQIFLKTIKKLSKPNGILVLHDNYYVKLDNYSCSEIISKECMSQFAMNSLLVSEYINNKDLKDIHCMQQSITNAEDVLLKLNQLSLDNTRQLYKYVKSFHMSLSHRMNEYYSCCDFAQCVLMDFKESQAIKM